MSSEYKNNMVSAGSMLFGANHQGKQVSCFLVTQLRVQGAHQKKKNHTVLIGRSRASQKRVFNKNLQLHPLSVFCAEQYKGIAT